MGRTNQLRLLKPSCRITRHIHRSSYARSESLVDVAAKGTPFKHEENPREKGPITDTTSALLIARDAKLCSVCTKMTSPGLMSIGTMTYTAHTILRKSGCERHPDICPLPSGSLSQ